MSPECSTWNSAPSEALWYGLLVIEREDGETDYTYAYSANDTDTPDVDELCPEGCTILERQLFLTPLGKEIIGEWATDEQFGLDAYESE